MKHVKIIALLLVLIAVMAVTGCCCICGCPSTGHKCPCHKSPMGCRHRGCIDGISIDASDNCTSVNAGDWHYKPG